MPRQKLDQPSADVSADDAGHRAIIGLAADLVSAFVGRNHVPASEIALLIRSVHASLTALAGGAGNAPEFTPAVSPKKSISDDFIICLEDGKKLRTLKRYLNTHFNMSPEEYRAKWSLPFDYPMVAPSYARLRSDFAKQAGLGRTPASGKRRRNRAA
jgi:predicted transcriptional regulator